jgi:hypothetical protein
VDIDRLHQIVAHLERLQGRPCPRAEIEKIAAELGREPKEQLSDGRIWKSTFPEIDAYLVIPNSDPLPRSAVNAAVSILFRWDYQAWLRFLESQRRRFLGEQSDENDKTVN